MFVNQLLHFSYFLAIIFINTKKHIFDENRFDEDSYIIMENNSNHKSTGIIAKIFEDHWDVYYSKYKNTIDLKRNNVDKEST